MLKIKYGGNILAWNEISELIVDGTELVAITTDELSIVLRIFESASDATTIKEWLEATQASIPAIGGGGVIIIVIDDF